MKRTLLIISLTSLVLLLLGALSFGSCTRPDKGGTKKDSTSINTKVDESTTYNIFIENSGSMKGYFSGNSTSDLETIINDYYDRLTSENTVESDTITLNYINKKKDDSKMSIQRYLSTAQSRCTEKYTKIDDILAMAMDNAKGNTVNIVVSDYCFESDNGNYQTAQSRINKLFTNKLNLNNDLSVAILKYEVGFNGKYFPGGIPCNRKLPVYFWIFGDANRVKKVLALNVKTQPEQNLLLQSSKSMDFKLDASSKRAIKGNEIHVKNLNADRKKSGGCSSSNLSSYSFKVIMDLSSSILSDQELKKTINYKMNSSSSSAYTIESITNQDSEYTFYISTEKPAPGSLDVAFKLFLPQWVEDSNYEGNGVPPAGKTTGIKYLIEGVYDAYHNKADSYFTFTINLK